MLNKIPELVTDYLDNAAEKQPNKIAFEDKECSISFKKLQDCSYCIASIIIENKIQGKNIAVYTDRNINCIIGFMGISYSGNTYVVLDNKSTGSRNIKILKKTNIQYIITDEKNKESAKKDFADRTLFILEEMLEKDYVEEVVLDAKKSIISSDAVQITFTSGSTGVPKGAIITHASIVNFIENISNLYGLNENTILGSHFPLHTISMLFDIYTTLRNMSKNCLFDDDMFKKPYQLAEYLCQKEVNTLYWSTSAVKLMAYYRFFSAADLSRIKIVIFGGEVVHAFEINQWLDNIPGVLMSNIYGATEITDIVTYNNIYDKLDEDEVVSIGKPINNTRIILLENGVPAQEGELCVEGVCLSKGYYNDELLTDKVFDKSYYGDFSGQRIYHTGDYAKWDDEGNLIYLGRKDFMVNRHSQRIELGEIENVAYELPMIAENACIFDDEREAIILFYEGKYDEEEVFAHLRSKLPTNMCPDRVVKLESMPHTLSNKINRVELKNRLKND